MKTICPIVSSSQLFDTFEQLAKIVFQMGHAQILKSFFKMKKKNTERVVYNKKCHTFNKLSDMFFFLRSNVDNIFVDNDACVVGDIAWFLDDIISLPLRTFTLYCKIN